MFWVCIENIISGHYHVDGHGKWWNQPLMFWECLQWRKNNIQHHNVLRCKFDRCRDKHSGRTVDNTWHAHWLKVTFKLESLDSSGSFPWSCRLTHHMLFTCYSPTKLLKLRQSSCWPASDDRLSPRGPKQFEGFGSKHFTTFRILWTQKKTCQNWGQNSTKRVAVDCRDVFKVGSPRQKGISPRSSSGTKIVCL